MTTSFGASPVRSTFGWSGRKTAKMLGVSRSTIQAAESSRFGGPLTNYIRRQAGLINRWLDGVSGWYSDNSHT